MNAKEAKDGVTALEIARIVVPLLSLPVGTLILALVPQVRDRIWPATPKGLLLALLVVSLSAILGLVPYTLRLRKQLKTARDIGTQNTNIEAKLQQANAQNESLNKRVAELTYVANHEMFVQTVGLLEAFRNNLPKHELKLGDLEEYHSLISDLENLLGNDLYAFRIPHTAMEVREIITSMSFDAFGHSDSVAPTETFCRTENFKRRIDGLIAFLAHKQP
jgi:hypothetical protein